MERSDTRSWLSRNETHVGSHDSSSEHDRTNVLCFESASRWVKVGKY